VQGWRRTRARGGGERASTPGGERIYDGHAHNSGRGGKRTEGGEGGCCGGRPSMGADGGCGSGEKERKRNPS
jgi:hypothetical protein